MRKYSKGMEEMRKNECLKIIEDNGGNYVVKAQKGCYMLFNLNKSNCFVAIDLIKEEDGKEEYEEMGRPENTYTLQAWKGDNGIGDIVGAKGFEEAFNFASDMMGNL